MTLTLTLREAPAAPVGAEALAPRRARRPEPRPRSSGSSCGTATRARRRRAVRRGRRRDDDVRVEGDLARVAGLGAGMAGGRLTIAGDAGPHVGRRDARRRDRRRGRRGRLGRRGDARRAARRARLRRPPRSAAPTPGSRAGMRGGEILVHGDAGDEAGAGLRRGLIAVAGRAGRRRRPERARGHDRRVRRARRPPGAGMRRASIVAMGAAALLPTYARACTYRPPFLRLCLRRLRELGLPVTDEQIEGRYTRWSGDGLELQAR